MSKYLPYKLNKDFAKIPKDCHNIAVSLGDPILCTLYIQAGTKNSHAAKAKYFHYRVKYFSENFTGYKEVILTYYLQISAQNIHPLKSCTL